MRARALHRLGEMNLSTARDHALRIAMWSVITSEAVMFAALIALRGGPRMTPTLPTLVVAAAIGAALFGVGASLEAALQRTREGRPVFAMRYVALACVLGCGALVVELAAVRLLGLTDALSTMIVGLHAAHISAGIALVSWVLVLVKCGRINRRCHDVVGLVGSYWYFVAAVWIFVWPLFAAPRP